MRKLVPLFVLLLVPACVCAASAWKFVSPMPNPRYAHAACLGPDGKIHVMGGLVVENREPGLCHMDGLLSNLIYEPKTDKWKYLTPVPGYPLGGTLGLAYDKNTHKYIDCNYAENYNLSPLSIYKKYGIWNLSYKLVREHKLVFTIKCGDKVIRLPPGKTPNDMDWIRKTGFVRVGVGVDAVAAKDGRIWWIGGSGPWTHLGGSPGENIVIPYDPARNAWIDATMPEDDGDSPLATIYHTKIPPMHERRVDAVAVTASDGKIYVMGGYRQLGGNWRLTYVKAGPRIVRRKDDGPSKKPEGLAVSDTMECYDPRTNSWEYKKPLSSPRMEFSAAMGSDNKIYVFGGFAGLGQKKGTPVLATTEVYDPKTNTWSEGKPMPETRVFHAAVHAANGKIYVIGGSRTLHSPPLASVLVYDPVKDSWSKGPSMNVPRGSPAAVATPDGKIYVVGGTSFGAYPGREKINRFLPEGHKIDAGKVQASVEVLNVFK